MIGDPLPDGPPLDAEAILGLADGTPIVVMWSGGNGPHHYTVQRSAGLVVAASSWEVEHDQLDPDKDLERFVGQERYHTRVWLDAELDEALG